MSDEIFRNDKKEDPFFEIKIKEDKTYFRNFGLDNSSFDKDITNINTIKLFLPIALGEDYLKILSKDYISNLYSRHSSSFYINDNVSEETIVLKIEEFRQKIKELNEYLINIVNKCTLCYNKDNFEICNFLGISEETILIEDCLNIDNEKKYIKFDIHPSIPKINKYLNDNFIDNFIDGIFDRLSKLSSLSVYLHDTFNPYRQCMTDIILRMYGNSVAQYPRSILNYSLFGFCIDGYPYKTKNKRIYSIDNPKLNSNKFEYYDTYVKNTDALLTFMTDLDLATHVEEEEYSEKIFEYEKRIIKNSYGLLVSLFALKCEYLHIEYIKTVNFLIK